MAWQSARSPLKHYCKTVVIKPSSPTHKSSEPTKLCIGILDLQGNSAQHQRCLAQLKVNSVLVRSAQQLAQIDGLILPGGESTTLLHHLRQGHWLEAARNFCQHHPCLGTCAGLILLARHVQPNQPSFGVLEVTVQRNAYGRQTNSRIQIASESVFTDQPLKMPLIRAPQIIAWHETVAVLAWDQQSPTFVQQGHCFGCTFHPELIDDTRIHARFIAACRTHRQCTH